jgi:hypothetical protein
MNGGDLYVLKGILGHKSIAMTQRYAHLSPAYTKAMVDKMDQIWTKQTATEDQRPAPARPKRYAAQGPCVAIPSQIPRSPSRASSKPASRAAFGTYTGGANGLRGTDIKRRPLPCQVQIPSEMVRQWAHEIPGKLLQ